VSSDGEREAVDLRVLDLVDRRVAAVALEGMHATLKLMFEGDVELAIHPIPGERGRSPPCPPTSLCYWEIFMPHDEIFQCGPGAGWSVDRTDIPPRCERCGMPGKHRCYG
jgi:hypothetical protein